MTSEKILNMTPQEIIELFEINQYHIDELEKELRIEKNIIKNLPNEDDWTFIIKIHAITEAALSTMIIIELEKPNLHNVISKLSLQNSHTGKRAFIKALELLPENILGILDFLTKLRNQLVHDTTCLSLTIEQLLSKKSNLEIFNRILGDTFPNLTVDKQCRYLFMAFLKIVSLKIKVMRLKKDQVLLNNKIKEKKTR